MHTGFGGETATHHLEGLGVDGRIILKLIFKKWDGGIDWNGLAQERGYGGLLQTC
jgi:hypothetical protein